jgi:type I restriction-modification system DNA methylase subunit
MIPETKVYKIQDTDSLLTFLREELNWQLPEADIGDLTFEWTGTELNLSEDVRKKLKDGVIHQLQPFRTEQPWGVFVVDFAIPMVSVLTLRQILRRLVSKRRLQRPDVPSWKCENLLFICLYGENGFSFAHFKGEDPYGSRLATFSWRPGDPIRTLCEYNLPALEYDDRWDAELWVAEWQKAFDVEKVNKLFYRQITQLYYRLTGKEGYKRELVLPSVGDDTRNVGFYEEFSVRLIGRTIFCWFLKHKKSDKGVSLIPAEILSLAAVQKTTADYYHTVLEPLFFEVMNKRVKDRKPLTIPHSEIIPFLNGGLFESHSNDFYRDMPNYGLKIPDTWFKDFFGLLEQYNFTITENSSIDVDVAVDPEMLGRIFENLLAEIVPETGETARKATGSYYTPRAIVDYMAEQSLKQYLLARTGFPEETLNRLFSYEENIGDLTESQKEAVVTALSEIKVIDPACGSGAFPIGVLHRLLLLMEKADPRMEIWRRHYLGSLDSIVRQTVEKNVRKENWAYIRKLMVIRDSIYGVDIQAIAVEIAKLRCFLSLIVDEVVADAEDNRGIEPLPNLEFKFVAANTLIGLPSAASQSAFGVTATVNKLKELREAYLRSFAAEKVQIEKAFKATQQKLFKENVQWAVADNLVKQLTEWDPFSYESCTWFDPGWMFGIEDGFDVVIANPPYIDSELMVNLGQKDLRETIQRTYTMTRGNWDIYIAFFERGFRALNKNGVLTFITPDKWISKPFGDALRKAIIDNIFCILRSGRGVFESSNVDSIISFLSSVKHNQLKITDSEHDRFVLKRQIDKRSLKPPFAFDYLFSDHLPILLKIDNMPKKLSDLASCENACATSDAYKLEPLIKDLSVAFDRNRQLKIVNTGTMGKYYPRWGTHEMTYLGHKYLCPIVDRGKFLSLFRNSYGQKAIQPKIIIKGLNLLDACLDSDGNIIPGKSTLLVAGTDIRKLKFMLSIINSRLAFFYLRERYPASSYNLGTNFTKEMINDLPLPQINEDERKPFISLVDDILAIMISVDYSASKEKQLKVKEYQRQIDQMVYKLYGLTQEEIGVVEGAGRK